MKNTILFLLCMTSIGLSVQAQNKYALNIVSTSCSAHFIIKDPQGRRTGIDPRNCIDSEVGNFINEIPNAAYGSETPGDNPDDTSGVIPCDDINRVFFNIFESPANDGDFEITVFGLQLGTIDLHVKVDPIEDSTLQTYNRVEPTIIVDSNTIQKYIFNYHGESGGEITFVKVVTDTSLIEEITTLQKIGWISTQVIADKYIAFLTTYRAQIHQNNFSMAQTTLNTVIQNLIADSSGSITRNAFMPLYADVNQLLRQIPPSGYNVKLINSIGTKLTGGALQYYEGSWKDAVNNNDGTFSIDTKLKTLSLRMTYEYGTQTTSNVSISNDTIVFQTVNAQIQLQNSSGVLIDTGSVQYYTGAWRNLGVTTNGTATKELLPANYSFRMSYAYASKDKQQDIGTNATVIFQTVNAAVQLQNSQGALIDQGTVQYYSGAWRAFGTTNNGTTNKELLPNNYSFRMTYGFASKDKQQDVGTNATVVFQTVNAAVQLRNSQGSLIDQGTVQYYSGAWRTLGTTNNGTTNKELLPNNYSFRMSYAYASKDKQQDIGTNPTVVFQTVNAAVQLKNSLGNLIDQGTVQYYSGAWRTFGTTSNGVVTKDLLPNTYSFRMMYDYVSVDKAQDISTNNSVSFSTVLCTVRVKNSQNQLVDNAMASYYSGAWRVIGNTVSGDVTKELLPVNLSFRVKYGTQQQDKQQNLSTNNIVEFGIQ